MPLSFVPYATPPTNELSKPDRIDTTHEKAGRVEPKKDLITSSDGTVLLRSGPT